MKRNITINIDELNLPDVPKKELHTAIGRLSVWALDDYDIVKIYKDGKTDLTARYFKSDNTGEYTIGAVWRGNEFTFHS
jgi:hypothetical protein